MSTVDITLVRQVRQCGVCSRVLRRDCARSCVRERNSTGHSRHCRLTVAPATMHELVVSDTLLLRTQELATGNSHASTVENDWSLLLAA